MSQTKAQLLNPLGDTAFSGQLTGVGATFSANIRAVDGVFTGNVSVAGTLTKQDVTNVDSVGVITARSGIKVTAGGIDCTGITSITGADDTDNFVIDVGGGSQFVVHTDSSDGEISLRSQDGSGNNYSKYMTFFTQPSGAVVAPRLTITSGGGLKYHNADSPTNANSQSQILNHTGGFQFYGSSDSGTHRNIIFGTNNASAGERLRITSTGQVAIGTVTGETNYLTTINGDLSLGEKNGTSNTFIDQKQDGDLHLINSGRSAQGGSGSPGVAGVGINRYNNISGDTTKFRDFAVYNGKDSKVLVVDGSASSVGVGTDTPQHKLHVEGTFINSKNVNSTGDAGIMVANTHRLGFDQSGTRSWTVRATGGNLEVQSGDGNGALKGASTGGVHDNKGNVRSIPQNYQANAYTLVANDAGKHILADNNITWTDGTFAAGDVVTIINASGGNITITKGTQMYNTADGTNANRTLASKGMATILWVSGNSSYISGSGLS